MDRKFTIACLACMLAAMLTSSVASYADTCTTSTCLQLTSGASTVVINDNQAGDLNSQSNMITFLGSVGVWGINVSTGAGSPPLSIGNMDISTLDTNTSTSASTLTISFTQTGLTEPVGFEGSQLSIGGTGDSGSTVQYSAYWDPDNSAFGTTDLLGSTSSLSGSSFSTTIFGSDYVFTGPYSMTEVITISDDPATTSFNAMLQIPEPASLSICGAGLLGLAWSLRKKLSGQS